MNPIRLLPGFTSTEDQTTIIHDLRSGRAGWLIRVGLSVAAAPILIAPFMFLYALIEISHYRIRDEHIALALGISGAIWCASLTFIWAGYRRFARMLKTAFAVVGVWVIAIPACFFIDSLPAGEEFLMAGVILTASSLTIFLITTCVYRSIGGKRILNQLGDIAVNCPTCGYSLVGLDACRCPECGQNNTIDELIAAQDYEALRPIHAINLNLPQPHPPHTQPAEPRTIIDLEEPRRIESPAQEQADLPPDILPEPT